VLTRYNFAFLQPGGELPPRSVNPSLGRAQGATQRVCDLFVRQIMFMKQDKRLTVIWTDLSQPQLDLLVQVVC